MTTTEERVVFVRGRDRTFTWEEYNELHEAINAAEEGEDEEEFERLISLLPMTTNVLLALKNTYGKEYILEWDLDTTRADEELGKGWLDARGESS